MSDAATTLENGYLALRAGRGAARVPQAVIWVEGPDAAGFLHGLLSNDIVALDTGDSTEALLLDARGRVRVRMGVLRDGPEAFTLAVDPATAPLLIEDLERYHFSEELDILGPEPAEAVVAVGGAEAGDSPPLPGPFPGARLLLADDPAATIAALGLPEVPTEAIEWARVAAGQARVGVDTLPTTLVQEAELQERAVSFTKGCYLGQETVARAQFRGRVNRTLRRLRLEGPLPPPGATLEHEGRAVGTLTSIAPTPDLGPLGLAVIRRTAAEADPPARLAIADHPDSWAVVLEDPAPDSAP